MKKFIEDYLKRGFGSMNKNDFEVAIFNEILKDDEYRSLSDFALSRKLKITEAKIDKLRYEASIKYGDQLDYAVEFLKVLNDAKTDDGKVVKLLIPNKSVRQYVKSIMIEKRMIIDTSFNSQIIVTNREDIYKVADLLFGEEKKDELVLKYKQESKDKDNTITFKDVVLKFVEGFGNGCGTAIIQSFL